MQAFDQAWAIVKMPYHGTDSDSFSEIMSFGINPGKDDHSQGLSFAAGFEGEKGTDEYTTTSEEQAMLDAWIYALENVLSRGIPLKPHLLYINPEHPDVDYYPDMRHGMERLGQKGHVATGKNIPVDAIEEVFEGDEWDPDCIEDEEEYRTRQMQLLEDIL